MLLDTSNDDISEKISLLAICLNMVSLMIIIVKYFTAKLESRMKESDLRIASMKQAHDGEVSNLKSDVQKMKGEWEGASYKLKQDIEEVKRAHEEEVKASNETMREMSTKFKYKMEEEKRKSKQFKDEMKNLQEDFEDLKTANDLAAVTLKHFEVENEELKTSNDRLEDELSRAVQELEELKSKNEQIKSHILRIEEDLSISNEKLDDLKDKNAKMNEICQSSEDEIDEIYRRHFGDFYDVIKKLKNNDPELKVLIFPRGNPNFSVDSWQQIGKYLNGNRVIKEVHFVGCRYINDEIIQAMFGSVNWSPNSNIRSVDFEYCSFGSEGAKNLVPFLRASTGITKIRMGGNKIGSEGLESIVDALDERAITGLLFGRCGIDDISCLRNFKLPQLESLDLDENSIGDEGAKIIVNHLLPYAPMLKGLRVGGCGISNHWIESIESATSATIHN